MVLHAAYGLARIRIRLTIGCKGFLPPAQGPRHHLFHRQERNMCRHELDRRLHSLKHAGCPLPASWCVRPWTCQPAPWFCVALVQSCVIVSWAIQPHLQDPHLQSATSTGSSKATWSKFITEVRLHGLQHSDCSGEARGSGARL